MGQAEQWFSGRPAWRCEEIGSFTSGIGASSSGSPADPWASPVASQCKQGVRWRRCTAASPASPAVAAERRKVTNFQPFPPHEEHVAGLAAISQVMTGIMAALTSRGSSVTVHSGPGLSHLCVMTVSALG